MVGEQPFKRRDMVGSDSGLGHLLVNTTNYYSFVRPKQNIMYSNFPEHLKSELQNVQYSNDYGIHKLVMKKMRKDYFTLKAFAICFCNSLSTR